ncbi:MAG: tetratricopeptide repeat protein [Elusimicrobiota bacterium]
MSAKQEKSCRGPVAILVAVVLGVVFLAWRSAQDDDVMVTTYRSASAPSVPLAPQAETRQSLDAMAGNYFSGQHYEEAIPIYRKILARDPDDAAVYNELGLALHYSGKSEEAVDALKKATALDPQLQRAWLSYGFVLNSMGRRKQARAALEKTVALDPATPQGLEAKAMLKR